MPLSPSLKVRIFQNERGAAKYGKWREPGFQAGLETVFAAEPICSSSRFTQEPELTALQCTARA